ncbi:DUF808 domain-containing protein [Alteromonas aestuariivivens]|uniref:DUF808 domain-containing protein n=1 Tax=Alteromonas aestuariivivens TaxID=1938339 RepID=A0A3D8MA92_9ALTE|nr:DUF808 domain-containing protein [Alteromonas aestuariivivens]RDV26730.1 DUF808 domain-containing protein [Alteromonas aestuariivivens]
MAAANLLALFDDIATLLDDIATMSKVAAKKTAGVLGDDLALNADQVQGVRAERELPVVWAVAKGSFLNKLILVPAALLISAFVPILILVLLVIGGLYLCFEGAEKVLHRFIPPPDDEHTREIRLNNLATENVDMVALEKEKIKGAIRTDFILSAEIIVIVLGTVQETDLLTQLGVLSAVSVAITAGVYGIVAGIVKMDDAGLYLLRKSVSGSWNRLQRTLGRGLLITAPLLMKTLAILGTIAMFLVGGGILTHNIPLLHHFSESLTQLAPALVSVLPVIIDGIFGFIAGTLLVGVMSVANRFRHAAN